MSIAQINTITAQPASGLKNWIIAKLSSIRAWRQRRRQRRIDRLAFQQMLYTHPTRKPENEMYL